MLQDWNYQKPQVPSENSPKKLVQVLQKSKCLQDIIPLFISVILILSIIAWFVSDDHANTDIFFYPSRLREVENPAIVWFTPDVWWMKLNRKVNCQNGSRVFTCDVYRPETQPANPEAYLFYGSAIDKIPLPRNPKTIWGLLHYESPTNTLVLMHEKALNLFNFSATFSRFSDVPLPLIWMGGVEALKSPQYFVNTLTKNSLLSKLAPVLYMQSDSFTSTQRDDYVKELMKYIQVDSYGASLHNKELPLDAMYSNAKAETNLYLYHLYGDELCSFMARYKFIITIENGVCSDYMTEKIWRALDVGAVPIYFGSPLIRDWLPNNKSAILLEDFPTPKLLSQHLHYLLQNDTAYEEYLEHKTLGLISNEKLLDEVETRPYQMKLDEVISKFECFICEKIHKNDSSVNVVTKKHFDCPLPTSALTLSENLNDSWVPYINDAMARILRMYMEIENADQRQRKSETSWW